VDDLWPEDPVDIGAIRSRFMKGLAEILAKMAYKIADMITPISPGYTKVIEGKYSVPKSKIHVIKGGVDISKFKPISSRDDGKFTVLYSGAFSVAYDFNQVLKAAKILEKHENVEIVLQGGGELLNYIKQRVEEMELKIVRIIDRILSRREVAKLIGEADALLLPLKDFGRSYLGISSKLYEYQAVGKPIICCANGQPAEYVKETRSGVVVKPGEYEALAKAVLYLKNNSYLAKELGKSGRRYVEDNVSIEKIGKEMMNVIQHVTEKLRICHK
jgi:glycosyltransferase involved in cell wall biosynthesis